MARSLKHEVVIIGGGSAGTATAASMLKRRPSLDIAIVEPSEDHYYQPGWTMVGGGVFEHGDQAHHGERYAEAGPWLKQAAARNPKTIRSRSATARRSPTAF